MCRCLLTVVVNFSFVLLGASPTLRVYRCSPATARFIEAKCADDHVPMRSRTIPCAVHALALLRCTRVQGSNFSTVTILPIPGGEPSRLAMRATDLAFISAAALHLDTRTARKRARASLQASTVRSTPSRVAAAALPQNGAAAIGNEQMRSQLISLAARRGAMGRGVRACLRALHQRAAHIADASPIGAVYVECGPAYVLATATTQGEKVTRYAVERRAWPALRRILQWDEVSLHEAKARGARLRSLHAGGRYGRHLFFDAHILKTATKVAVHFCLSTVQADVRDSDVEAVIKLRRMPLPGARTVSARCPRGSAHRNGDRTPSLMLWMNADGVSGGAMCPVCIEPKPQKHRFLTWRVQYLPDYRAVLRTPRTRTHMSPPPLSVAPSPPKRAAVKRNYDDPTPVGGFVSDATQAALVGRVQHLAYVTATLKCVGGGEDVELRSRTVGTVVRQNCPLRALMWSERRTRGSVAEERATEVAWFARQSSDALLTSDWLPTQMLSVSAMRPTRWRDVQARSRLVSVPAAWEPSAQAWIVFDFDDLHHLPLDIATVSAKRMVATLRRDIHLSGRCAVVHTGPNGMHAWAELREPRDQPRNWFAHPDTSAWYEKLGERVLAAAHRAGARGGKVDHACCAAGRFARRPGWRVLPDGSLFRASVVTVAASRVRNRLPRLS